MQSSYKDLAAATQDGHPLKSSSYGLMTQNGNPMCEECDLEMSPFAGQTGDKWLSGWACHGCGWSIDQVADQSESKDLSVAQELRHSSLLANQPLSSADKEDGLSIAKPTLRALKVVDGQIVQIGMAESELDHGQPFWLCRTSAPLEQQHFCVKDKSDACAWLYDMGADTVLEAIEIMDPRSNLTS